MKCTQATQLLSENLDRPLTKSERLSLTLHTSMCSACRRFGQQMQDISKLSKLYVSNNSDAEEKK